MVRSTILAEDGAARRGLLETPHGRMETPGFFAVATRAALKGLDRDAARRAGLDAPICNAFHPHLQPGGAARPRPREYTEAATERNLRWARRCREEFERLDMGVRQALYGIAHGGVYADLRERSARGTSELGFEGFGIGDCLGESKADWYRVVDVVAPMLPRERPRHLLGVGDPDDLVEGALRGMDTFDCAMPTRIARHAQALVFGRPRYRLDLTSAGPGIRDGDGPIDEACDCTTCGEYSRACIAHLVRAREMLGISLLAEHNLRFLTRLLERVREAITAGRLAELRREVVV